MEQFGSPNRLSVNTEEDMLEFTCTHVHVYNRKTIWPLQRSVMLCCCLHMTSLRWTKRRHLIYSTSTQRTICDLVHVMFSPVFLVWYKIIVWLLHTTQNGKKKAWEKYWKDHCKKSNPETSMVGLAYFVWEVMIFKVEFEIFVLNTSTQRPRSSKKYTEQQSSTECDVKEQWS